MKNSKKAQNSLTETNQGEVKKHLSPQAKKKLRILAIVIAVVAALTALILINKTALYADLTYYFMPKELVAEVDDQKVTFYVYRNKDFNQFKDKDVTKAFGFYYYNSKNEKVDLSYNKSYEELDGTKFTPIVWFSLKANENLNNLKDKISKAVPFAVIAAVILLIVLWFFNWSKREDMKKAELYGEKNAKKKSANKKGRKNN